MSKLKFCEVSRILILNWTWKFQLSILKNKKVLFLKNIFFKPRYIQKKALAVSIFLKILGQTTKYPFKKNGCNHLKFEQRFQLPVMEFFLLSTFLKTNMSWLKKVFEVVTYLWEHFFITSLHWGKRRSISLERVA